MLQPHKNIGTTLLSGYRYSFNGMESDDEVKGDDNSYDFGARIYDARIGRWLSRDPLEARYSSQSPYNFVANNPICFVDLNGEEIIITWKSNALDSDGNEILVDGKPVVIINEYIYGSGQPVPDVLFVQQSIEAVDYLVNNELGDIAGTEQNVIDYFMNPANDVYIQQGDDSQESSGVVSWDPTEGVKTDDGGILSPSLVLLHEMGHALITDVLSKVSTVKGIPIPEIEKWLSEDPGGEWHSNEEKVVIEKIEAPSAEKVNQPVREDHNDVKVTTEGPTSTTEASVQNE